MAVPDPLAHHWYTPAECAALLGGKPHGERWRAPCPVHGGTNPTALGIAQGRDREGNPMTLLHCFAQDCPVEEICAAMGIEVKDLFVIHPPLPVRIGMRHGPAAHAWSVLRTLQDPSP